ncbi:MAG: hypothetical protein WEA10_03155 [Actinomycetota bacterium]
MATTTTALVIRRRASLALASALVLLLIVPALAAAAEPSNQDLDRKEEHTDIAIGDVQDRLTALSDQIAAQQQAAVRLQAEIAGSVRELGAAQRAFDDTQQSLMEVRARLATVEAEHAQIQERLSDRAVAAVRISQGSSLEFVLDSSSLTEVGDRMEFLTQLQVADESLAGEAVSSAATLEAARASEEAQLARHVDLVNQLDTEKEELAKALVDQQWRLDAIADAKAEARSLLAQLNARAEKIAEQRFSVGAAGGGATFGAWAKAFLTYIDAPTCTDNLVIMVTWQVSEYTEARWNPLATTLDMPGATMFNSVGVKNYASLEQGLEATEMTLVNGSETYGYGSVLQGLHRCADRMVTATAIRNSSWCAGCAGGAYVTGLVPIVERYWDRYANESAWA